MSSELEDRRQRAREAAHDMPIGSGPRRIDAAIETATRVQITPEAIDAFGQAWHREGVEGERQVPGTRRRAGLTAALRALGFEVVE